MEQSRVQRAAGRFKQQVTILGSVIFIIWLLEIVDILLFQQGLNALGVWPRQVSGLWGIFLMPLLHGGLAHVAANTMPFLILGWLVMLRSIVDFIIVTAISMLLTGTGLWLFGSSNAVYIGASGIIFAYFGFLLLRGYFERSPQSILIALIVAFFYGGLILGVLPQRPGISWEAHLFGFLTGVLAARLLARKAQPAQSTSEPIYPYDQSLYD
jgi:membrane associated rhomboid family serine protease